jgi:hypothetical protein
MEQQQPYDIDTIFFKWTSICNEISECRFRYKERKVLLNVLMDQLIASKIPYSDAKMLETKVYNFLLTENGKTSKEKKSWRENVVNDFKAVLADRYFTWTPSDKVQSSKKKRIHDGF